jgi:molybdate transport system substrate-binding protein
MKFLVQWKHRRMFRVAASSGPIEVLKSAVVRVLCTAVLVLPTAAVAQVKVIMSGGFSSAYQKVLPEFERTSGIKVTTSTGASQGDGPNTIGAQLRNGAPADVVIMNRLGLNELISQGRIVAGTDIDVAQTSLGVTVRAGASKPDIRTIDAFKQTLLRARSVAIDSSTSAIYLASKVFPRLGITNQMSGKTLPEGANAVASGSAEIAVLPVSEILPVRGVEFVGLIPAEIQEVNVFAAAVLAGTKQIETSKRLIAFLTSHSTVAAIKQSGMEPLGRQ